MIFLYIALTVLAVVFMARVVRKDKIPLPQPSGKPLIGNVFDYTAASMHLKLSDWAYQYGPVYAISVFGQRIVILSSGDLLRKAFSTAEFRDQFSGRQPSFLGKHFCYGNQGITLQNDLKIHSAVRKTFTKCLNKYGEGLQAFEELITKETQRLVKRLKLWTGQDYKPSEDLRCFLANVISTLLSGETVNETWKTDDTLWAYNWSTNELLSAKMILILSMFPFIRFLPGHVRDVFITAKETRQNILTRFFDDVKATYDPQQTRGLVDAMFHSQREDLEAGREVLLTDEQICSIIQETASAGLNTSASTFCSILLCLIHNQGVQEKVHAEVLEVIGPDRPPRLSDRHKMPYLEAVIHEGLRYAPPAPLAIPHLCKADVEFEGYTIKEGDLRLLETRAGLRKTCFIGKAILRNCFI